MAARSTIPRSGRVDGPDPARMKSLRPSWKLDLNLVLVVLLAVFAFAPLTRPGYFESHSGFLPVFNLYDLEQNLWKDWAWRPHAVTAPNVVTGEGPLPYLIAESLRWLGLSGTQAIKGVYSLGVLLSGLGTYALGKRLFGGAGGLLAAVVYVYLPFHLAAIYVRGALAEAWALALFPLALLCWHGSTTRSSWLWAAGAILAQCALASSNFGLSLLFALLVLPFITALRTSRRRKARAFLLLVLALLAASVLQLPAVIRYGLAESHGVDFVAHFVYPFQLLSAQWGFGTSMPAWQDSLPLQLGLAATGLSLVAVLVILGSREVDTVLKRLVMFLAVAAAVSVLLVTQPSAVVWRVTHLSSLIHYPWQLLVFAGLSMSLLAGTVLQLAPRLTSLSWKAALVSLVILASYGYISPRFTDLDVANSPVGVFEDKVLLLSYQREGPLRHGATVRLRLYWQGLVPMDEDYVVFVHIVDDAGQIWAQCDSMLQDGQRPTSTWIPGEIIEDECRMTIDVEGPPEGYTLEVGLYEHDSGQRLTLASGGTSVALR
jgi:hypothetical protein